MPNEDIFNPEYWKNRIDTRGTDIHKSMYVGSVDQFKIIHDRHVGLLDYYQIKFNESIVDVGCGYGRLLGMLPKEWIGDYVGIDISPDMIKLAKENYPTRTFYLCNLLDEDEVLAVLEKTREKFKYKRKQKFSIAICLWIHKMIVDNKGEDTWNKILRNINQISNDIFIID